MEKKISLRRVYKDDPTVNYLEKINKEAFPQNEYLSMEYMYGFMDKSQNSEILAIREDGNPVGYFSLIRYEKCLFIFYFAIDKKYRGKGIGTKALKALKERYYDCQIVVEFESVDVECDNLEIRKRRRDFYMRNGFVPSGLCLAYMQEEFTLGFIPTDDKPDFDGETFKNCCLDIQKTAPEFHPKMYNR